MAPTTNNPICESPVISGSHIVHGVFVVVSGTGILILGESGTGKSEVALELVSKGHTLVADDVVVVEEREGQLFGEAPVRFAGLLAVRGLGVIDIRRIFGDPFVTARCKIELCVELKEPPAVTSPIRMLDYPSVLSIFGVEVPRFEFSCDQGRNLPLLIETAVKLIRSGETAAEEQLLLEHESALFKTTFDQIRPI